MGVTIFALAGLVSIFAGTRFINASFYFSKAENSYPATKKKLAVSGWCLLVAGALVLAISLR